jgi:hypothetical protein
MQSGFKTDFGSPERTQKYVRKPKLVLGTECAKIA